MALHHQPASKTPQPHIHLKGEQCPVCDQPIPNDRAEEVRLRMEMRDRELTEANERVLTDRLTREHAAAMESAKAEAAQKEVAAREAYQRQNDNLTRANAELLVSTKAEIAAIRAEAMQKAATAREEGSQAARAASLEQITALAQAKLAAEASAKEKIDALTQANADVRAAALREKAEVESAARERIEAAEIARFAAQNEAKAIKEGHETLMNERLLEQREALEKATAIALNERNSKHFEENQKLKDKLDEAVRKLEQKTIEELGEGAHLDLLEELKDRFEEDRIRRVPRGAAGADIIHEIIEHGTVCGKIVYDSKNRTQWRSEYATKLRDDKVAEGANHAVLSLLKFPAEARQLDIREGVILANPARVAMIAELLRESIVRSHCLRLSSEEREKKQGELYAYITGDRFKEHLNSVGSQTDKLLDIEVAEEAAQQRVRKARGVILKALQKTEGNLRADVGRIIGTVDALETQ